MELKLRAGPDDPRWDCRWLEIKAVGHLSGSWAFSFQLDAGKRIISLMVIRAPALSVVEKLCQSLAHRDIPG